MAIGLYTDAESERRTRYAVLCEAYTQRFALPGFTELSMGMSGDLIDTIQEGSTMIRIGTAIFGKRNYS